MLTDTKLRNLKPQTKMYKVVDRDGLYVAVSKTGIVSFIAKFVPRERALTPFEIDLMYK